MVFGVCLAASAAAWNLPVQQAPPRHAASRAAAARMHGPSVSTATELRELRLDPEKAANLMEAQLDPQVAQGPFGKGGALEWVATLTDAWATLALAQLHFFDDKEEKVDVARKKVQKDNALKLKIRYMLVMRDYQR